MGESAGAQLATRGTDAASRSRPATVIARASPWPRVQWLPCPVGVAMAEVGDDETVTLFFARKIVPRGLRSVGSAYAPRPESPRCRALPDQRRAGRIRRESPPSFRHEQAAHSPLFGQSGAISRDTASMTASLLVVRSGAVVALNSGFRVAQALAIDWTRTRIAVASHRSVNLPSL